MFFKKKEKMNTDPIGGFSFFISFPCLFLISMVNIFYLKELIDSNGLKNLVYFLIAGTIGAWFSFLFIRAHISVFIHEFKHSLISNLVGNKDKGWKVKKETGHFQYSYTEKTAKFNALISLAPYFIPLFSFPVLIVSLFIFSQTQSFPVPLLGLAAGADFYLNIKDIGRHQSDFTNLIGGFTLGIIFVILINTAWYTYLLSFVLADIFGFKYLFFGLYETGVNLYFLIKEIN